MKQTEIVACIYKHIGRTDDLESLTELAEEIARIAAEEEREACASALERIGESPAGEYLIGKDLADLCAAAIRSRSNC